MTHVPYTKDEIKVLNKFYAEQKRAKEELLEKSVIKELASIGFDCLAAYKRYIQRFAYLMMWRACSLGIAIEYDFGRGKGKFKTAETYSIDDVVNVLWTDEEAHKIARRYIKTRAKHGITYD